MAVRGRQRTRCERQLAIGGRKEQVDSGVCLLLCGAGVLSTRQRSPTRLVGKRRPARRLRNRCRQLDRCVRLCPVSPGWQHVSGIHFRLHSLCYAFDRDSAVALPFAALLSASSSPVRSPKACRPQ